MEGSIGFGLGSALWSEITVVDGRVQQSNFHDFRILRIDEMPRVEVHIVPSAAPPTGVGEPGVPPIAPAVANAWLALGGAPVRRLPFSRLACRRAALVMTAPVGWRTAAAVAALCLPAARRGERASRGQRADGRDTARARGVRRHRRPHPALRRDLP